MLLAVIKSRINGNSSAILMNKSVNTWTDLKSELNTLFKKRYNNLQLHREMIAHKQNINENVIQYTQRCETLQRRLLQNEKSGTKDEDWTGKSEYIKSNILSSFINGLKDNLSSYCNNKSPKNVIEASAYSLKKMSHVQLPI